jgi:alpha-glucuronidase
MRKTILCLLLTFLNFLAGAEDGYRLWLRYDLVQDKARLEQYRTLIGSFRISIPVTPVTDAARKELQAALKGLLGKEIPENRASANSLEVASAKNIPPATGQTADLGEEGFRIQTKVSNGKTVTYILSQTDKGALYGVFHFLRLLQTGTDIRNLSIASKPLIRNRILNHWDNLDRHVERGYAGISLWDWHTLPGYIDQRYIDYARANASIGINGTVLTNVNANALVLTEDYLVKAAALAQVFRPYGIRVYLTARFSAPIEIGGL